MIHGISPTHPEYIYIYTHTHLKLHIQINNKLLVFSPFPTFSNQPNRKLSGIQHWVLRVKITAHENWDYILVWFFKSLRQARQNWANVS